mmetsp:Transcript_2279/g.5778  ORF Transcript_2279/g.5778 Transcript_2279/m.5778 type:complete len:219 (+) Transcript_2279:97-753(+)
MCHAPHPGNTGHLATGSATNPSPPPAHQPTQPATSTAAHGATRSVPAHSSMLHAQRPLRPATTAQHSMQPKRNTRHQALPRTRTTEPAGPSSQSQISTPPAHPMDQSASSEARSQVLGAVHAHARPRHPCGRLHRLHPEDAAVCADGHALDGCVVLGLPLDLSHQCVVQVQAVVRVRGGGHLVGSELQLVHPGVTSQVNGQLNRLLGGSLATRIPGFI